MVLILKESQFRATQQQKMAVLNLKKENNLTLNQTIKSVKEKFGWEIGKSTVSKWISEAPEIEKQVTEGLNSTRKIPIPETEKRLAEWIDFANRKSVY